MPVNESLSLLSPDEVARALNVSRKTVYKLAARGLIASLRVGGLLRFTEADLRTYLEGIRRTTHGRGVGGSVDDR
jgi:excisionase family DNA binding protein